GAGSPRRPRSLLSLLGGLPGHGGLAVRCIGGRGVGPAPGAARSPPFRARRDRRRSHAPGGRPHPPPGPPLRPRPPPVLPTLFPPDGLRREAGLHMLRPYERGKIPVVLIHGLGSSPMAWGRVVNELRGDPALRARYQFWSYMYPTGNPFMLSAAQLRRALVEA